ncbi:MAG: CDGSH iron-sulfur domain-containing protein [Solirubrobacteraceae bacterium]
MSVLVGVADEARGLMARADALRVQCETFAGEASDEATRATLSRIADRLSSSVVRPLCTALNLPPTPPEDGEAESLDALAHALHVMAIDATQLRVRAAGALSLQEAAAALQELACQAVAEDAQRLEARRSELASLMAGLPASIQSAPNGPYLFTNVTDMTDWLGVAVRPTPQAAVCRCGASNLKPWCDGSHAQIGFDDAKSTTRVADRLDRYRGLGVSVDDNRGTCQHSGFCTDRLPSVFRADDEPFVAPAGGRVDEIVRAARDCPSGALSAALADRDPTGCSDSDRPAAVEVSKDGPYRVTGSLLLLDHDGAPEIRNEGASTEHYALCRCGKSQNKPFCSGMHWYADFHDPPEPEQATLFQWAGGFPALLRLTRRFYEVHVPNDRLLSGLFAQMSPDHPERVAAWLGQVFGGPPAYSDHYGEYDRMISQHLDKALSPEQRARWVQLLQRSADEVGLPADAEFRAAFTAYLEWGSRIALENSRPGVHPPPHMPVPRWWWVCDAYPWSRSHATAEEPAATDERALPGPDEQLSYEAHIKPLFRERDRTSMRFAFDLWSHADVSTNADAILERLKAGTMPCDGPWPGERVELFERWIATAKPS